jgi:signal transduction histidine kinase
MVAVVRDVSARKELEAQLLQAQKLESIGRLAGGIAHDFNNLLTAIGGYADLVYEHVTNEFVREDVAEIRKGVERATALTRQLLAFARRNAHMPQVVALNEVTLQTQKLLQRLLGPTITLHTELASEPTFVLADPIEIEQVLVNMAVNARDAMPNGGRLLLTTSVVGNDERGALVRLQVCDTGMGMSEEVLAHLFEPFFTTKPPGEGTGLGLATCYGIVQQHGGQIAVESRLGEGTTFTIELPACAPEEQCLSPDPICAPLPKGREVRTEHERPRG